MTNDTRPMDERNDLSPSQCAVLDRLAKGYVLKYMPGYPSIWTEDLELVRQSTINALLSRKLIYDDMGRLLLTKLGREIR